MPLSFTKCGLLFSNYTGNVPLVTIKTLYGYIPQSSMKPLETLYSHKFQIKASRRISALSNRHQCTLKLLFTAWRLQQLQYRKRSAICMKSNFDDISHTTVTLGGRDEEWRLGVSGIKSKYKFLRSLNFFRVGGSTTLISGSNGG